MKLFSKVGLTSVALSGLAFCAPISAPDTSDITTTITNMATAGLAVVVAFVAAKWGIRAVKAMFQ